MDHPQEPLDDTTCALCENPAELVELYYSQHVVHLCSWSCLVVWAAGRERDFRLYLVGLAEQHSSAIRAGA